MMQPHLLPWVGYLELLSESDIFIVLDDFQLSRQSWSTRNRLFVNQNRVGWISLELDHSSDVGSNFLECHEDPRRRWRGRLSGLISQFYRRAEFSATVADLVDGWFQIDHDNVAELEIDLLMRLREGLGIQTEVVRSSQLKSLGGERSDRLRSMLGDVGATQYLTPVGSAQYMLEDGGWESIEVLVQDHIPRAYPQFCSEEFVPRLASLDALANVGWDGLSKVLCGTERWIPLGSLAAGR